MLTLGPPPPLAPLLVDASFLASDKVDVSRVLANDSSWVVSEPPPVKVRSVDIPTFTTLVTLGVFLFTNN